MAEKVKLIKHHNGTSTLTVAFIHETEAKSIRWCSILQLKHHCKALGLALHSKTYGMVANCYESDCKHSCIYLRMCNSDLSGLKGNSPVTSTCIHWNLVTVPTNEYMGDQLQRWWAQINNYSLCKDLGYNQSTKGRLHSDDRRSIYADTLEEQSTNGSKF